MFVGRYAAFVFLELLTTIGCLSISVLLLVAAIAAARAAVHIDFHRRRDHRVAELSLCLTLGVEYLMRELLYR